MQVFKAYFKVLNKFKGQLIMYICIFAVIFFSFIIPNINDNAKGQYVETICKFAVYDYDSSAASRELVSYLSGIHDLKEIGADEKETIQDELYARNVDCVLRIKAGFEEALKTGITDEYIETVVISGTNKATLFESDVNKFISYVDTYAGAGETVEQAVKKSEEALNVNVDVTLSDAGDAAVHSSMYYFFSYLGWVLIVMLITGISPILMVFDRKELRDRIFCSSYKFSSLNREMMYGIFVTGLGICAVFTMIGMIYFKGDMLSSKGGLQLLNMCCYMTVALAFAFMISKLAHNLEMLSMMGNIISLGMAFLCGVFVPAEYLGSKVIAVAHFLPTYWYVRATTEIDNIISGINAEIWECMGIELLFAAAIIVVGVVITRTKRTAR
jgi:ABC-2 type transport system permease protein